ncbi:MAG: disulfide bond formation protein B [Sphingomonadaceae bacterium]
MTRLAKARLVAILVPAALLAGALGSEHIGGLAPCEMCHWQRAAHYLALVFALVSLGFSMGRSGPPREAVSRSLVWLAALAIAVSGGIGVWHAGVEAGLLEGVTRCAAAPAAGGDEALLAEIMAAPMVRCDEVQWSLLGISMAGWNAIVSLFSAMVILWLSLKRPRAAA